MAAWLPSTRAAEIIPLPGGCRPPRRSFVAQMLRVTRSPQERGHPNSKTAQLYSSVPGQPFWASRGTGIGQLLKKVTRREPHSPPRRPPGQGSPPTLGYRGSLDSVSALQGGEETLLAPGGPDLSAWQLRPGSSSYLGRSPGVSWGKSPLDPSCLRSPPVFSSGKPATCLRPDAQGPRAPQASP